jgi:hypothetical protein
MLTEDQKQSNRRNAEKSCGPRTAEGKRISSQNSFKTGLYARSLIIQGEKQEDLETLQNEYYTHYQPQSPAERDLLDTMVRLAWQLRRYAHVESELWDWEIYEQTSSGSISRHYPLGDMFSHRGDKFSRLQRMQNAAQGKFKDALHELERLQTSRPARPVEEEPISADPGFVPSTEVGQAASPADAGEARTEPSLQPPSWFDPSTIWVHPPLDDPTHSYACSDADDSALPAAKVMQIAPVFSMHLERNPETRD